MNTGSQIQELMDIVTELCRLHPEVFSRCACGNMMVNCDCPPADPREALYDDPARGAR